jgi:anti-anti-sigma factor
LINGAAVVPAPAKINVKTAEQLRMALLEADRHGDATVVVDMTRTRLCHPAGLNVLAEAHQRALAEGGALRLVIPVGGAVARLLYLTGLDCFIPSFGSLEGALAAGR